CTDLARLLRVPGVLNYKNFKNGQEPKPVYVHTVNEVVYDFADFQRFATPLSSKVKNATVKAAKTVPVNPPNTQPATTDLSKLQGAICACEEASGGSRSDLDYALVCRAVSLDLDPDVVWDAVSGTSKSTERSRASYFDKAWDKAEAIRQQNE